MICFHMQTIILSILGFLARHIVRVHKPYIIGVTGTVGKTTITSHVAKFLSEQFGSTHVLHSQHHYNWEYGLPLTIIWAKSPWKNPFGWIGVFMFALTRLFRSYPKYLVLEYGIDHPGEMDFLLSIAVPDIAILTPVEPNHLEQFGTLVAYRNEKIKLIQGTKLSIVHESLRQFLEVETKYYSLWALSDINASNAVVDINGTSAIVHFEHKQFDVNLPSIGVFQVENILPLYFIANILKIDLDAVSKYTKNSSPEAWRSSLLQWINDNIIIDGSYNWGYLSIKEGIISMRSFLHSHRIIFFLWDMRELGDASQEIHETLAHDILDIIPHDANVQFYLVGPMMHEFVAPILWQKFDISTGLSSRDLWERIARELKIEPNTIVYVKWSQNTIFLEEGIKYMLANKKDISKLPRQSQMWMNKKNDFFVLLER